MIVLTWLATTMCWVAGCYRFVVSIRRPATWWSWSFTVAMLALAAGISAFALGTHLDRALGVNNLAELLVHCLVDVSAGAVSIYVLTLRSDRVAHRYLVVAVAGCALALATTVVSWTLAPFHGVEYVDLAVAPDSAAGSVYFVTWYAYLGCVLTLTAAWCYRELTTVSHLRRSVRAGLWIIGGSTACGALGFVIGLVRIVLVALTGDGYTEMQRPFNLLVMGSLVGIAWGTLLFILAPRLGQWWGDRKLVRNLAPVGARMRELYPAIALGASADHPTVAIRAQRLVIEIGDGLRLLPVASGQHHSAAQVIADAMRSDRHTDTGHTASDLLSASQSRREEYEMLQDIASKFRRQVRS